MSDIRTYSKHACNWPGCQTQVPVEFWGCNKHWFALPQTLRDRVRYAFRPEKAQQSRSYAEAMHAVKAWIERKERTT